MMRIAPFMEKHFRHFNARETLEAAKGWVEFQRKGGKMVVCLAGAMSTGEIGLSLAPLIRKGKVHAISCTAANLEEDIFNLVAHDDYRIIPNWRALSVEDEEKLFAQGYNRVTDTCIPETVMRHIESHLIQYWDSAAKSGTSHFPYEYFRRMIEDGVLRGINQIPMEHSWVVAAHETDIPVYSPGFEDSTLGNIFTARVMGGRVKGHAAVRHGTEQFEHLIHWYLENSMDREIGFFQIGGGIAGDFAICSVPCIIQDLKKDCRLWGYFCQISDAVTSYGGYSGAVPNEKITWCKLSRECPKFMIQSDASIVAPLIFEYVLERSSAVRTPGRVSRRKQHEAQKEDAVSGKRPAGIGA